MFSKLVTIVSFQHINPIGLSRRVSRDGHSPLSRVVIVPRIMISSLSSVTTCLGPWVLMSRSVDALFLYNDINHKISD